MSGNGRMTRDLWLMITFSCLRTIADLFFGTFFISYIMQLSSFEILSVSMYKLFEFTATMGGFFMFAHWCKRYNKVSVFILNNVPKILLLCMIIFLGERVVDYIIPMGALFGLGAAMYHLPMHLMIGEKVAPNSMARYVGAKNAAVYVTKVAAPVLLGLFITVGSYREMAIALLVVAAIELVLSTMFTPSRHRVRRSIDFRGFARCMLRFPVVRKIMWMEILRGFSISSTLGTVITMYTVYMFKTDLNLGIFTTIFAICSILTSMAFGRWARRSNFITLLMMCTLMTLGAMGLFIVTTTPITFLIYNFVYSTAIILLGLICDTNVYSLAQARCIGPSHRVEYFVFRDGALFIGRAVAFVALMYVGVFGDASWLRYYLGVITGAAVLCGIMSARICPRIRPR